MSASEIAQWAIDNRYPKSDKEKVSDTEFFHFLVDAINALANEKPFVTAFKLCDNYDVTFGRKYEILEHENDEHGNKSFLIENDRGIKISVPDYMIIRHKEPEKIQELLKLQSTADNIFFGDGKLEEWRSLIREIESKR